MQPFPLNHALALAAFGFSLVVSSSPAAVRYVNTSNSVPVSPYTTWANAAKTIQQAVDVASTGDTILVTNGIYQTGARSVSGTMSNRVAVTKAVAVKSVNGPAVTTIRGYQLPGTTNGDGAIRCVYLTNGASLTGFTLSGGATRLTGGYYTESCGGGVYCESETAVVSNCVFTGNVAFREGGGACYGTINNSAFGFNSAGHGGGTTEAIVNNSVFTNNTATYPNNGFGGAAYNGVIKNSLMRSNIAEYGGGGLTGGVGINCTIVHNTARFGGGASNCALTNTILYYNTALDRPNYYNQTLSRCCTYPPSGNSFSNAPLFVNVDAGDYRLTDLSLCVNAGDSSVATGTVDFAGNPRVVGGGVDIGAFELQTPFQLPAGPFTHTRSARSIHSTDAMLAGSVVPRGLTTLAWFEWGALGGYGQTTTPESVGSGNGLLAISATITNLLPRGLYQFRLMASNALGVVTGNQHTFTTGRKIHTWGDNWSGQTNVPVNVTNAVAVSGGGSHSVALQNDGSVVAWGNNDFGQANVPASLSSNVIAIAAGGMHSMALRKDGTVTVWGDNSYQQRFLPVGMSNIVEIAGGGSGCMALTGDGTVFSWGYNYFGQTNVPASVTNIVAIDMGNYFNMALRADGVVLTWGENYDGETNVPPGLGGVVIAAAGSDHGLALRADGAVVGWGSIALGQSIIPETLTNVIGLSAGGYHSLALQSSGAVTVWGGNTFNQLALPTNLNHVVSISAGGTHNLVIGNKTPDALPQVLAAPRDDDVVISLGAGDADADPLSRRIVTLPVNGQLFQYTNGTRGTAITTNQTIVTDAVGRVIFVPVAGQTGSPHATFNFVANDGILDSASATVTVNIIGGSPYAYTQPATVFSANRATLRGMVAPQGLPTSAWFEWGTSNTFSFTTSPVALGNGIAVTQLSTVISNVANAPPHQFRLVVSNALGVVYGFPQRFVSGYRVRSWGYNFYDQTNVPAGLSNAVAFAGGGDFSLVLRDDGTVSAWGIATYSPTFVPAGLSNVVQIAAGYAHSLALKNDGTLVAWGSLLGGSILPAYVPAGLSNVVAVAGGYGHSLALKSDGTVAAWGFGSFGETAIPASLSNVVAIAAGDWHNVALQADGTVVAWGDSNHDKTAVPPGLSNIVCIEASSINSIVLQSNGTAVAWGFDVLAQNLIPPGVSNLIAISAGSSHTLALQNDGSVLLWGDSSFGQTNALAGLINVAAIAAGGRHNLALVPNTAPQSFAQTLSPPPNADAVITLGATDIDADVLALRIVGLPAAGQLYQCTNGLRGDAITNANTVVTDPLRRVVFAPVTGALGNPYDAFSYVASDGTLESATASVTISIFAGFQLLTRPANDIKLTSAALNGFVAPKGFATAAWFEWGTNTSYSQTTPVTDTGSGLGVVHIAQQIAGLVSGQVIHFRLVASNASQTIYGADQQFVTSGKVTAWGDNFSGQSATQTNLGAVVFVAGGLSHSLALRADGTVAAWGNNAHGQTNVPPTMAGVIAVAAGGFHNLALLTNGSVTAWGRNNLGQTNVSVSASNVVALAAGGQHSVALRADGSLVAWGDNSQGQRTISAALTNIVGIAAGWYHNVALRSDGTVVAWGANTYGQSTAPANLTNVIWVGAGLYHSLALRSDGTMAAWGLNSSGQTNIPASATNIIAVTCGGSHDLAMQTNGALTGWGYNFFSQATPPSSLSNVVSFAAGGSHSLALLPNRLPVAFNQVIAGYPNMDLLVTLNGADADDDAVSYRISALPLAGAVYQLSGGTRGAQIIAPNTSVADPLNRIIFAPAANQAGIPHATFGFVADDGFAFSIPATVTANIMLPIAPTIDMPASGVTTNHAFQLAFTGATNATYRVWASTNLVDWESLGTATSTLPGQFLFLDISATNHPLRFYRATAP